MDIKSIVKEQRQELEEISKREHIIARDSIGDAKAFLKHPNVLVITGMRRCGKSIFSYLLERGSNFAYINFDDERLSGFRGEELDKVMEAFYGLYGGIDTIILDEIQNIPHWELFVNRLRRTKKVILTGSNSNMLSGELATHLTGRYIDIKLFPFSFGEFLRFRNFEQSKAYTAEEKALLQKHLTDYLEIGGLPEAYKFGQPIIARTYEDIVTKDVLLRYGIKKIAALRGLAKYLVTNSAGEITYSKLAGILGLRDTMTVSNWLSYLEDAFLFFRLERFDFKLKRQFLAPKKIYCADTGMVNTVGFKFSEDRGRMMESAVAIELQRRKARDSKMEVYYWKDHQQNEVDFVIKKGHAVRQLVQVTYASRREDIRERETESLLKAGKELRCSNLLVITWNHDAEIKTGGRKSEAANLFDELIKKRDEYRENVKRATMVIDGETLPLEKNPMG
ncbi:MAG: ATP-binding protein, partial [archaeon]